PLPGVTPPTTLVPYSRHCLAWNVPSRPVMPWTMTRVLRSHQIAIDGHLLRRRDHLLRRVPHAVRGDQRQARLGEDLLAQVDVRPFEADDDGDGQSDLARRADHALGDAVAAHDPAEDVDEDRFHVLVAEDDAERVGYLFGAGAAADVEEVRGLAAGQLDDVHGGHGQPRAVDHAADGAVELDVVQPELRG